MLNDSLFSTGSIRINISRFYRTEELYSVVLMIIVLWEDNFELKQEQW